MEGNFKKWINRINSKQDVLTEYNVGEFMDSELTTKSTPTSGDTVLGRDSLTGKAVEIPTSSFGGGGGGSGLALGETSSTAYRGDRGKIAYDHSQTTGNPHGTTKTDIGLGNVDNTSDLNKPISTATQQALNNKLDKGTYTGNASDLKSLIDTKADLVGGKVPKAQSQPSTMVMDNSTYVITFTDATGAVQTIDLPLESLFKDANYDAQTKSLIVTLQDGTTRTIPLTDLVDLPEIVLSTTNPAVNPTTGQKVYFNTSLGKVWFNVSGAWVFAGNLISDSEKANISTAYNHSQTTGNPHNTTKADIGLGNVDNTSDLNKPISNATQNALNSKENSSNKVTDFTSPNNTTFPTTQAIINENKKATITVELINLLTTSFYAPNALRINSTALINGSGTITLKVNDVAYTLGNLIAQGAKITVETTTASVYNLIGIYE